MTEHTRRDAELRDIRRRQPYDINLDGLRLWIAKDVFPPDLGYSSRRLAEVLTRYDADVAMEMGCGSGYLALVLSRRGVKEVWAVDNHEPAIACTAENVARNPPLAVRIVKSDLFAAIEPGTLFDLIVFNQPFYPSTTPGGIFGLRSDGGRSIIERFLTQAREFITRDAAILMPFSEMAGADNNPGLIAEKLGFRAKVVQPASDGPHAHFIYEIRLL